MKLTKYLFFIMILFATNAVLAQKRASVIGKWATIDDVSGKKRSVVEIFKKGDKIHGKIIKLFDENRQDAICDKCEKDDPRYNKPIIGLEILTGLEKDGKEYDDGQILDPESGKIYNCKMWIEDGNLVVRGYIGFSFIGRSQTWQPY